MPVSPNFRVQAIPIEGLGLPQEGQKTLKNHFERRQGGEPLILILIDGFMDLRYQLFFDTIEREETPLRPLRQIQHVRTSAFNPMGHCSRVSRIYTMRIFEILNSQGTNRWICILKLRVKDDRVHVDFCEAIEVTYKYIDHSSWICLNLKNPVFDPDGTRLQNRVNSFLSNNILA